jgi:predicted N-formylglutamate amidohydrolase
MARELATAFTAPLLTSNVSRLLVDLNRSVGHPRLHSKASRKAPAELRQLISKHYYQPYRAKAQHLVMQAITNNGYVIHLSSHSFTPELEGIVRNADIGLLYDSTRPGEVDLCERWKAALKDSAPGLSIRRNYPYSGKGDGLTSWFRKQLPPDVYMGIELEINQKHVFRAGQQWTSLRRLVVDSLRETLESRCSGIFT